MYGLTITNDGRFAVINIAHCDQSPGLNARKIWEALFRLVHAEKFESFDSFLCDLRSFEGLLKNPILHDAEKGIDCVIYWEWSNDGRWTDTIAFETGSRCYRIEVRIGEYIDIKLLNDHSDR